jgi:hypothetical protein
MTNEAASHLAQIMMTTWPGHPRRHLNWVSGEECKEVREFPERADLVAYSRHLATSACAGPGSIGVLPGINTHGVWRSPWAVLDFDGQRPEALAPYLDVLRRNGLTFTYSTGSTGRGAHVWFLLDQAITLKQGYGALTFLNRVARTMGFGRPDLRPDGVAATGSGILLPYRGGDADQAGANPLWDPATGAQILLGDLPQHPRQEARSFARLAQRTDAGLYISGVVKPSPRVPRLPSVLAHDQDRWATEVQRLAGVWTKGKRHHLTLAATAYGVRQGVAHEQILADLTGLAEQCGDDVAGRRLTIRHSLDRATQGEPLAFHPFYRKADVPSPAGGTTPEVQGIVAGLIGALMAGAWSGRSGKTDRSLLKALLALAWTHGHNHPDGVEVSVAWSQLEIAANIGSRPTLSKSLQRLERAGWLCRAAPPNGFMSGSFVLLEQNYITPMTGGETTQVRLEEWCSSAHHLRYGRDRLGKRAEQIIDVLRWFGPQSKMQLAERLGSRAVDLRDTLSKLSGAQLIETVNDTLVLHPDFDGHLERQEQQDGSQKARDDQERLNKDKRDEYRKRLNRERIGRR